MAVAEPAFLACHSHFSASARKYSARVCMLATSPEKRYYGANATSGLTATLSEAVTDMTLTVLRRLSKRETVAKSGTSHVLSGVSCGPGIGWRGIGGDLVTYNFAVLHMLVLIKRGTSLKSRKWLCYFRTHFCTPIFIVVSYLRGVFDNCRYV